MGSLRALDQRAIARVEASDAPITPRRGRSPLVRESYRQSLRDQLQWLRATRWFRWAAVAWLIAVVIYDVHQSAIISSPVAQAAWFAVTCSVVVWLTPHPQAVAPWDATRQRHSIRALRVRLVWVGACVALFFLYSAALHEVVSPVWLHRVGIYSQVHALNAFTLRHGWNQLVTAYLCVVVPALGLILLRARPRELGLQLGYRSLLVSGIVLVPMLGNIAAQLAAGNFGSTVLTHTIQNGPMEELLYRGALLTAVAAFAEVPAALLITSVIFGLAHLPIYLDPRSHWGLASGIAACLASQAVAGVAYALLYIRTRSLIAPSVFHVATNGFSIVG